MLFEAIAWRGLDNLLLPLFGFYLLRLYLGMDQAALLARLAVMLGLIAFALLYRRFTTLAGSGVLGAALFGYAAWTLGGWLWLTPPVVMFVAYAFLSPPTPQTSRPVHNVHAVLSVVAAGLLWLFLNKSLESPALLAPYVAGFAAHLGLTAVARLKHDFPHWKAAHLLPVCILEGWLIIVAPFVVVAGFSTFALAVAGAALVGTAVAVVGFYCCQPRIEDCPLDTPRWVRQGTCGAVGSLAGLAVCWVA
jgi:phytol kinase